MEKTKKEKLSSSLLEWFEENEEKRGALVILFDDEEGTTTGVLYGKGDRIVGGIINELVSDPEIANIVVESVEYYCELMAQEMSQLRKEENNTPKYLS